jgi:hypothetical protein
MNWELLSKLVEMDEEAVKKRAYALAYGDYPWLIADNTILAYMEGRSGWPLRHRRSSPSHL